jgi:hypothetical protein
MELVDTTAARQRLQARLVFVSEAARATAEAVCADYPALASSVVRLIEFDDGFSYFQLLPFTIVAMLGEKPDLARPICVLSRIWWAGAETLDDISDGDFDSLRARLSPAQARLASIFCLSIMPQHIINTSAVSPAISAGWRSELEDSSVRYASDQLDDLTLRPGSISRSASVRDYAAKSGAPYARDAAMSAMLATSSTETVSCWRRFGALFGALRQLCIDRGARNIDLAHGTASLLAGPVTRGGSQDQAAMLSKRIDRIHGRLVDLIGRLAAPSPDRDLVSWMIDVSARGARSPVMQARAGLREQAIR